MVIKSIKFVIEINSYVPYQRFVGKVSHRVCLEYVKYYYSAFIFTVWSDNDKF